MGWSENVLLVYVWILMCYLFLNYPVLHITLGMIAPEVVVLLFQTLFQLSWNLYCYLSMLVLHAHRVSEGSWKNLSNLVSIKIDCCYLMMVILWLAVWFSRISMDLPFPKCLKNLQRDLLESSRMSEESRVNLKYSRNPFDDFFLWRISVVNLDVREKKKSDAAIYLIGYYLISINERIVIVLLRTFLGIVQELWTILSESKRKKTLRIY